MEKLILRVMEKQYSFGDKFTNDEVLAATGGTKSSYTGKWQVIGVENGKLKLVSVKNVGNVTLGYNDPNAIGSSEFEKALDSYKKAGTTLNNASKSYTGISTARSVTLVDINNAVGRQNIQGTQYTFYYNTYYQKVSLRERSSPSGYTSQTFINKAGNIVTIDAPGKEVIVEENFDNIYLTSEQKSKAGTLITGNSFFLATQCADVDLNSYIASFGYRLMQVSYIYPTSLVWSNGRSNNMNGGVRAIVYI